MPFGLVIQRSRLPSSDAGKTTLAHTIAAALGCPAICRDEIKEGMVHAVLGHADPDPDRPPDEAEHRMGYHAFSRISLHAPALEVDTTDGYQPGLDQIVAFVNRPA